MGILDLLSLFHCFFEMGNILLTIIVSNISSCSTVSFLRDPGRICTQIGDHTYCAAALDIHAFIQLLCQTHGLLRRKIQCFGSLLLKSTGSKRKWRILGAFSFLYLGNLILLPLQSLQYLVHLLLIMDLHPLVCAIESGFQWLFLSIYNEVSIQAPVFFRNKRIDLILSVADDT